MLYSLKNSVKPFFSQAKGQFSNFLRSSFSTREQEKANPIAKNSHLLIKINLT